MTAVDKYLLDTQATIHAYKLEGMVGNPGRRTTILIPAVEVRDTLVKSGCQLLVVRSRKQGTANTRRELAPLRSIQGRHDSIPAPRQGKRRQGSCISRIRMVADC